MSHLVTLSLLLLFPLSSLRAAVIWSESTNGLLSSSPSVPTSLPLSLGSNTIISSFGGGSSFDYFSFTLADGQKLTSFNLNSYVSTDSVAWIGIQAGPAWTAAYDTSMMISQQHFGTANIGQAILNITTVNPLNSGTYTVRSQQLGATADYQLGLTVIPEPTTISLLLLALALGSRRSF